jgi:glutathione S-transferase
MVAGCASRILWQLETTSLVPGRSASKQEASMSLALYGHPFSSYTRKVLIVLCENGTPFEFRCIGPETPQHAAEWLQRWPLHKFPLLLDGKRAYAWLESRLAGKTWAAGGEFTLADCAAAPTVIA